MVPSKPASYRCRGAATTRPGPLLESARRRCLSRLPTRRARRAAAARCRHAPPVPGLARHAARSGCRAGPVRICCTAAAGRGGSAPPVQHGSAPPTYSRTFSGQLSAWASSSLPVWRASSRRRSSSMTAWVSRRFSLPVPSRSTGQGIASSRKGRSPAPAGTPSSRRPRRARSGCRSSGRAGGRRSGARSTGLRLRPRSGSTARFGEDDAGAGAARRAVAPDVEVARRRAARCFAGSLEPGVAGLRWGSPPAR